jgi:glutaminase
MRGVAVCEAISEELELHFLRAARPSISAVRSRSTLRKLGSKRVRLAAEREQLAAIGHQAVVYQLQGDLSFAGIEAAIRKLVREPPEVRHFVLDLGRVTDVDPPSVRLLLELHASLVRQGRTVGFAGMARHPRLVRSLDEERARDATLPRAIFDELDVAVEWCEDALLAGSGTGVESRREIALAEHELLRGLDAAQLEHVTGLLERRGFAAREMVVRKGDPAAELFLLVEGALSVFSDLPDGRLRRLATLSPGMGFGEPAMVEGATRTASVRADQPSVCWVLKRADLDGLDASAPVLKIRLLENLLRSATKTFDRLSFEAVAEQL